MINRSSYIEYFYDLGFELSQINTMFQLAHAGFSVVEILQYIFQLFSDICLNGVKVDLKILGIFFHHIADHFDRLASIITFAICKKYHSMVCVRIVMRL